MITVAPGFLHWGGSDEPIRGQSFPRKAARKWEEEFGWEDQHHLVWVGFSRIDRPSKLEPALTLTKRIIDSGGWVQLTMVGTPAALASVPVEQRDPWNGRLNYMKYRPSSNEAWANDYYLRTVKAFHKAVGLERLYFNIWTEPNHWWWRNSDERFFQLYDVTQKVVQDWEKKNKIQLKFGGYQHADMSDRAGPNPPFFIETPTEEYINRFLEYGKENDWQIDYFDMFEYSVDPYRVSNRIMEIETFFMDQGKGDIEFILNSLSHAGSIIDPWSQESAQHTLTLAKLLHKYTKVNRVGFDFLEDSSDPAWNDFLQNGLLEWETLRERPRWAAARKILNWEGK